MLGNKPVFMYDYVVLKIFASESYKSNNTKGIVGKGASALLWTGTVSINQM